MLSDKPKIVCLCGSTRFKDAFDEVWPDVVDSWVNLPVNWSKIDSVGLNSYNLAQVDCSIHTPLTSLPHCFQKFTGSVGLVG